MKILTLQQARKLAIDALINKEEQRRMSRINEMEKIEIPTEEGYYWVHVYGYKRDEPWRIAYVYRDYLGKLLAEVCDDIYFDMDFELDTLFDWIKIEEPSNRIENEQKT